MRKILSLFALFFLTFFGFRAMTRGLLRFEDVIDARASM